MCFGEGKDYPLQCAGLENSMDCVVHGVAKSRTQWSVFRFHFHYVFGRWGCKDEQTRRGLYLLVPYTVVKGREKQHLQVNM